jgi:hypothetical protein
MERREILVFVASSTEIFEASKGKMWRLKGD